MRLQGMKIFGFYDFANWAGGKLSQKKFVLKVDKSLNFRNVKHEKEHMYDYNHHRPHDALRGLPPVPYLKQGSAVNVAASVELSGAKA